MKEFEICFNDLNQEAQQEYLEFIGGKDEVNDYIPLAIVAIEEEEEE